MRRSFVGGLRTADVQGRQETADDKCCRRWNRSPGTDTKAPRCWERVIGCAAATGTWPAGGLQTHLRVHGCRQFPPSTRPASAAAPTCRPFHFTSLPTSHSCLSKLHPHHWQNILGDFTMVCRQRIGTLPRSPLDSYVETNSVTQSQLQNSSYALAALTAGGGIMGYVRTRSVPSLVAGSAVGILCKRTSSSWRRSCASLSYVRLLTSARRHRRLSPPKPRALRHRAEPARLYYSRWICHPSGYQTQKARSYPPQRPVRLWPVHLWQCLPPEAVRPVQSSVMPR